jgi:hypothetical protein
VILSCEKLKGNLKGDLKGELKERHMISPHNKLYIRELYKKQDAYVCKKSSSRISN